MHGSRQSKSSLGYQCKMTGIVLFNFHELTQSLGLIMHYDPDML